MRRWSLAARNITDMGKKKKTGHKTATGDSLVEFDRKARERGLTYAQAQIEETLSKQPKWIPLKERERNALF